MNEEGNFISESGTVLFADDIDQYVKSADPVNVNYFREEYDELIKKIDEYASIVK